MFATPQGTLSAEISNVPVRTMRDGDWVPVDPTLQFREDGSVGPKAATTEVSFSGGGSDRLARFRQDGAVFDLNSPWPLPRPTLSGSKATYPRVMNGVDLVVEATAQGFSYNLVVNTREAAANPSLRALHFPVSTEQLELRTNQPGRPTYVDSQGRAVLSVGEAMMWDSSGQPRGAGEAKEAISPADVVGDGPVGGSKHAVMELDGDQTGLTVKPDRAMLADANTVFPVVLDPTMVGSRVKNAWTAVWERYPTTSFYKTEHSLGVGYEGYEQDKIVRSFFQFDVAAFTNKKIVSASLRTYEIHSASCTPRRVVVSRTASISAGTTWNNQPGGQADVATFDGAKGWSSSCPAGYVEFDVTNSIQYTSTNNGRIATFRLRAATESDPIGWKQFDSTGILNIEYIAYPLPAYDLGIATVSDVASDCAPSSVPTVVASVAPSLSARGRVAAGDTQASVKVDIQIVSPSGTVLTMISNQGPAGKLQTLTPSAPISAGVLYRYHARTRYPYPGGELLSQWSGDCYFKIDLTPPPAPIVSATYNGQDLTNCLDDPACPVIVPFGAKVTYKISSTSTDVTSLSYGYNAAYTTVAGRSVTVTMEPPGQTPTTLLAYSNDAAHHKSSETTKFKIMIGPGLPPVGSWTLDDTADGIADDGSGQGHPLTVVGPDPDDIGRIDKSMVLNGIADRASASAPIVDTSKNFTLSAWARLTEFSEGAVVGIFGAQGIAAQLYYSQGANRWLFMQTVTDTAGVAQNRAASIDPPLLNAWTHLVGVYNVNAKTMSLYVNGRLQSTTSITNVPWVASGPLELGWFRVGGKYGAAFSGSIDDVRVYPRIMSETEAGKLANPRIPVSGADEEIAGISADYKFDSVNSGADQVSRTPDDAYGADLTVSGFGSGDQTSAIQEDLDRGHVLAATGTVGEAVSIARPVVDATTSFTVRAWVKMADTSKSQIIARQAGTTRDSWRLEYRTGGGTTAQYVFSRATADSSSAAVVEAAQDTDVFTAGDWAYVVGIYDASSHSVHMKINGDAFSDAHAFAPLPIRSGTTAVGGSPIGYSPFNGYLDDLEIYAGVRPQRLLCIDSSGDELGCS